MKPGVKIGHKWAPDVGNFRMSIFGGGRPPNPRNDYSMSIFAGDDGSPPSGPMIWPQLQQQRTPYKCPKCGGKGWLAFDPAVGPKMLWHTGDWWPCNVCESGIIWSKS